MKKRQIKTEQINSGVLYQGDQSYGSVLYMQYLKDNVKLNENNVVLIKKKDGEYEARGYWDPKTQEAKIIGSDGKSIYNKTYTEVIKNKLADQETNVYIEPKQQTLTQVVKTTPHELLQSKEDTKENTGVSQNRQTVEYSLYKNDMQSSENSGTQKSLSSQGENNLTSEQKIQYAVFDLVTKSDSVSVKEFIDKLKEEKKYNDVVTELVTQTGLTKNEIEAELAKLDDMQRKGVISALANLFAQGKDIIYCAANALGTVLNGISKGLLAFRAILADAIAGIFVQNNQDLINNKSNQLVISAQAMQKVLTQYGQEYNGYEACVNDVIDGLGIGEFAIVHVGGNHFVTIVKKDDSTFILTDINSKEPIALTAMQLKDVMIKGYGLQSNDITTILAKENERFASNKIKKDLSDVLGALTSEQQNLLRDPQVAANYYTANGELSYQRLMASVYGENPTLSSEQAREFEQFYVNFLEKAIEGFNNKLNNPENQKPENEEVRQKLLASLDALARELAIVEVTLDLLQKNPTYTISGQLGQVLTDTRVDVGNHNFPDGQYYIVILISVDFAGSNRKVGDVDVPAYRVTTDTSVSTREGCTIILQDGSKYKVFGIEGTFQDQTVIFEYKGVFYKGTFLMSSVANIYLKDDNSRVYQVKEEEDKRPPSSGKYGEAAPQRNNWTRGIISEDEVGYMVSGAGSRITVKKTDDNSWKAVVVGIGTEALAGSVLRIAAYDRKRQDYGIYVEIQTGVMTFAGSYWSVSNGLIWKFNENRNTQQAIEDYIKVLIQLQMLSGEEKNKSKIGEIVLTITQNNFDYKNVVICGPPFSIADILKYTGISASVEIERGYTYNAISQGDIYKLTIEGDTKIIVKFDNEDNVLKYYATENINITINLPVNEFGNYDWMFTDGATSKNGVINSGQQICLATLLNNTPGLNIVNMVDVRVTTGYEVTGYDNEGQPIYDNNKPIYSTIKAGSLTLHGNSSGKYIMVNNLYGQFTS
ncbi:MAG: hypothetical protein LBM02_04155, partial [Lachnospiraceae bacterium]|nr:hypothetical protein [Lachnospiraceae bacterium]